MCEREIVMTPAEAAAAYAKENLFHPVTYDEMANAFLAGHAFAMNSPEVLALVEALKFYAQKPEPDIMSTFAKSAADWGEQCTTWGPLVDLGAIARITLAAFAKQPGGFG